MSMDYNLSVDEYLVNGCEISIDGYSKTLING